MVFLDKAAWNFLVDFGEIVALLPAVALGVLTLLLRGRAREAAAWTAAVAGTLVLTILGKLAFGGMPSGHASMSTVVYGGFALVAYSTGSRLGNAAATVLTALLATVVVAVYVLRWHLPADIVAGLALGGAFLVALARSIRAPLRLGEAAPALMLAAVALLAVHGARLDYTLAPFAVRL